MKHTLPPPGLHLLEPESHYSSLALPPLLWNIRRHTGVAQQLIDELASCPVTHTGDRYPYLVLKALRLLEELDEREKQDSQGLISSALMTPNLFLPVKAERLSDAQRIRDRLLDPTVLVDGGKRHEVIVDLRKHVAIPSLSKASLEFWRHAALSGYQGIGIDGFAERAGTLLIERGFAHGDILEGMCGITSIFPAGPDVRVVACDSCTEALFNHPSSPYRYRLRANLESTGIMSRFQERRFDCISITCGYSYLSDPLSLMQKLHQALRPGGTIAFIESFSRVFRPHMLTCFTPQYCAQQLSLAGYSKIGWQRTPFGDDFFLVHGSKKG